MKNQTNEFGRSESEMGTACKNLNDGSECISDKRNNESKYNNFIKEYNRIKQNR